MNQLPYAETVSYFQTSQTSPNTWMDKTKRLIKELGGKVIMEGYGNEPQSGRSAFMPAFEVGEDRFKLVWPVLPSRSKNERAAKIQAATLMYHDVKARCLSAAIFGAQHSFFAFLQLPRRSDRYRGIIPGAGQGDTGVICRATVGTG